MWSIGTGRVVRMPRAVFAARPATVEIFTANRDHVIRIAAVDGGALRSTTEAKVAEALVQTRDVQMPRPYTDDPQKQDRGKKSAPGGGKRAMVCHHRTTRRALAAATEGASCERNVL
jgi:hypothetical protein